MPSPAVAWQEDQAMMRLPFRHLALTTVSLPFFGFVFCIFWSLWFDFESSTATHCRVPNYLPSISAAIGGYTPQRYVWRITIGLHAAPRFLVAIMYGNFYQHRLLEDALWQCMAYGLASLHVLENACLVALTYVSSSENYPAHEKFFVTFVTSALTYMFLSCTVPRIACKKNLSIQDLKVLQIKSFLALTNFTGASGAVYFFVRHNSHCEPGMYTMFALCEYVVVLTNMAFHMCAFWDFRDQELHVTTLPFQQKIR